MEPGTLMTGSKRVDHWTSKAVYECSEIAGSPHVDIYIYVESSNDQIIVDII
jgi:hypothetical protein